MDIFWFMVIGVVVIGSVIFWLVRNRYYKEYTRHDGSRAHEWPKPRRRSHTRSSDDSGGWFDDSSGSDSGYSSGGDSGGGGGDD